MVNFISNQYLFNLSKLLEISLKIGISLIIWFVPILIWASSTPETALLNLFLAPLLVFSYFNFKKGGSKRLNNIVIGIGLSIFLTDLTNLITQFNDSFIWISLITAIIYQGFYIYYFREEGVRVTFNKLVSILKITLPSLCFFIVFGLFFLDHPNNLEYLLILLCDLETTLLIILAYFREKKGYSYWYVAFGATLLGVTNILYLFLNINLIPLSYVFLMIATYWMSHYLIFLGLIDCKPLFKKG